MSFAHLENDAAQFVQAIVDLKPCIAAFDADGTLWAPDSGEQFLYYELEHNLLAPEMAEWIQARYRLYMQGKIDEDTMCGEMVQVHKGLRDGLLREAATAYFRERIEPRVFPEMKELVARLTAQGCEVWAVSSTNRWVVECGVATYGIPGHRVLAAAVAMEGDVATDRLIRIPSDEGKPNALKGALKGRLDAAFGNSRFDRGMLEMAEHGVAINPNPDLEAVARTAGWRIYFPEAVWGRH